MSRFLTFVAALVVLIAASLVLAVDPVPQLHDNKFKLADSPCPKKDEHKLKCAIAIAECVSECIGDWAGCLECIIEKTAGGDTKDCCQTISHYAHFGCSKCNDLEKDIKNLNSTSTRKH